MHPILSLLVLAGALLVGSSAFTAITNADPTSLQVRLFKTELHNGSAWVTVFDNSAGVAVDLVTNPGAAFGTGTIAVGTYNKIRFTLENTLLYSSGVISTCSAATNASFLIDNAAAPTAPVTLTFATASATPPGGTSWYSNGSDANPLLMTGAVQVESGMTTNVNLQLNTQNTLACDSGSNTLTLNSPTMNVASRVVAATAFAGGDYWVIHFNIQRSPLRDAGGAVRNPSTYTETDWATVRGGTGYHLGWGARATFSPPDASGNGTATIVTDMTEHRHRVDQTGGCADCGIIVSSGLLGAVLTYTLSASNELTITVPGGDTVRGAFSRDYNTLIAADTDGADAGQDLVMGVKVSTTAPTMSGLYAWNGYSMDLDYITAPTPNPAAASTHVSADLGWINLITGGDGLGYNGYLEVSDPSLTTASGHTATRSEAMATVPAIVPAANGIYTDSTNEGLWLAVSPTAEVALVASGTNDTDPSRTFTDGAGNTHTRHNLGYTLALKQDPARTYTAADVAGTYVLAARWDDVQFGTPGIIGTTPPDGCRTFPDDISGSAACGTGVHPRAGSNYGRFTLSAAGTVIYDITETNDLGEVSSMTGTANFTVRKECIGLSSGVRLALTDSTCSGGQRLDMVVLNDGIKDFVKFLIGNGGDVLTFFDPQSVDPASPSVGKSRSLGNAVRLN